MERQSSSRSSSSAGLQGLGNMLLEKVRRQKGMRGTARAPKPAPSVPSPTSRYATIQAKTETFLSLIPASLSESYRTRLASDLHDILTECTEPPSVNVTFVGEMGAGKSKLLNVLLGTAVNKVGCMSAGTAHPTKLAFHKESSPKRAVELFSAEEWKARIQAVLEDAWDQGKESDDGKEILSALEAEFGQKLDPELLKDSTQIDALIKASPFYEYLGKRVTLDVKGSLSAGDAKSARILDNTLANINTSAQIPVKFEYRWLRSSILENGLNFVDSPGLGDTNAIRSAGTNRALAQATMICIVTPIKRSDSNRHTRELTRICYKQYLDGRHSQLILVCTQSDIGLPTSRAGFLDAFKDVAENEERVAEVETLITRLEDLEQQREEKTREHDEFLQAVQDMNIELPRKRARYDSKVDKLGHDEAHETGSEDESMSALQEHLDQVEDDIKSLRSTIEGIKSSFLKQYVLARNSYAKRHMLASLSHWLPKMDVTTIPLFTVGAECFERLDACDGRDECHSSATETEIPALLNYLKNTGSEKLKTHTVRLERRLALAAEQVRNILGSSDGAIPDLLPALQAVFGLKENSFTEMFERRLEALWQNSLDWTSALELSSFVAVQQTKVRLMSDENLIFKDGSDQVVCKALVMKAACRGDRQGVYVGINFNESVAELFLGCMQSEWDRIFFEIGKRFIHATDAMSIAVNEHIAQLSSLRFIGNENLKHRLLAVGETEKAVFHERMKTAAYIAGSSMELARQRMRLTLVKHIQTGLRPVYAEIMRTRGKGVVESAKKRIIKELVDPQSILDSCTDVLVRGLYGHFGEAWRVIVQAVEGAALRLKTSYLEMATNMDPTDAADVEARHKFLDCAEDILRQFAHDVSPSNDPALMSGSHEQRHSSIMENMQRLSVEG